MFVHANIFASIRKQTIKGNATKLKCKRKKIETLLKTDTY